MDWDFTGGTVDAGAGNRDSFRSLFWNTSTWIYDMLDSTFIGVRRGTTLGSSGSGGQVEPASPLIP